MRKPRRGIREKYATKRNLPIKKDLISKKTHLEELQILHHELNKSKAEVRDLNTQLAAAFRSIDILIKRVAELERSKYYRLKKLLSHYWKRLRSNFKTGGGEGFLSILYNYVFKRGGRVAREILAKILKHTYLFVEPRKVIIIEDFSDEIATTADYTHHLKSRKFTDIRIELIRRNIKAFKNSPLLSVIMPVYDPPITFLKQSLDSVVNQFYTNWELCIADDCSTDKEVRRTLDRYASKHKNIKIVYRTENGHISKSTNSAIELASGDYCVMLDHDDTLREDALYEIAKMINLHPDSELIYSDEDKIDEMGIHSEPHFKADWCPENLLSRNYVCHISAFKTEALRAMGGVRVGYEGSQDYDLVLRFTEKYKHIYHIPEVLYHWRSYAQSAAGTELAKPYALRAAQSAVTEALKRRGWNAKIDFNDGFRGHRVWIDLKHKHDLVSIIIPTKNKQDYLKRCIDSIVNKSTYRDFEIIVVDNNSDEKEFFELMDSYKEQDKFTFKYAKETSPFNFSFLMNRGRSVAKGKYLVSLNNDTEIITPDWIEGLIGQVQRPEIGVAGCKLLYENDTIQHAGVVVGLGGVAAHLFTRQDRDGPGYFNYINLLNNYSALTAACIMVRADVYDKVHGFDEKFTVEYNDVDFCLKVVEAGYRNVYIPHVELYHYESISRGHPLANPKSVKRHEKEANMFVKKWTKYVENDPCYNPNLTKHNDNFAIKVTI